MIDPLCSDLVRLLNEYEPRADAAQRLHVARFRALVAGPHDPFDRGSLLAHVTASALVTDPSHQHVLFIRHRKLGIWLQPGGHVERHLDRTLADAALREVREETGLSNLDVLSGGNLLDVDIHAIPARGDVPAHEHFDVCFLVEARDPSECKPDLTETEGLRWFPLGEIKVPRFEWAQRRLALRLMKTNRLALAS